MTNDMQEIFDLLDALLPDGAIAKGVQLGEIEATERELELVFPDSYRSFLLRYGALCTEVVTLLGLGVPPYLLPSVICATNVLRIVHPDAPRNLLPVQLIDNGIFACVQCQKDGTEGPVVRWDVRRPLDESSFVQLANDLLTYLRHLLLRQKWERAGLNQLKQRVDSLAKRYEYEHDAGGKLPRNYDWRPYRFCVQDVLLAATVVRHSRELNCLEVDVFLTADIPEYEPGSGARALTVFLLSEAFKCGGTMEIRFRRNVEDERVPAALREVALEAGVRLSHKNRIAPAESKELYLALTGFSPRLRQHIEALDRAGIVTVQRGCYAVHHGVWTRPEVESVILGSRYPHSILGGKALQEQRHLFCQDLLYGRAAVLGGVLDRKLSKREVSPGSDHVVQLEDTERRLEIDFEAETYAKRYQCHEETLPVPWVADESIQIDPIEPGNWLCALIRARDVADLRRHFSDDLDIAQSLAATPPPDGGSHRVVVVVPHDFDELPSQERDRWLNSARKATIAVLVCPETTASLDADVARRLARSRILRE